MSKICCDCKIEKPDEDFTLLRKNNKYEYRLNFCTKCAYIRRKLSDNPSNYYYAKNPTAWNKYQREYAKRKRQEKKNKSI